MYHMQHPHPNFSMKIHHFLAASLLSILGHSTTLAQNSLKVFILAGDESMLRSGSIDGIPRGPGASKTTPEEAAAKPGTLHNLVKENPRFAALGNPQDGWAVRDDVALYDAHPLYNNTREPARLLTVPTDTDDPRGFGVGVDLMFGNIVGHASQDPVLLIRFATNHQTWFRRGSRSLGHHYLPPSSGGGLDLDGSWDVIHFNHGVWDQQYLDPENPRKRAEPGKGRIRTSIEDYEKNLRTIVARLKQTGATVIWAHTTPILEGTPPGYVGGEMVDKYNAVAAKVMNENGVIINDLNAECRRMGKPEKLNVHDVGDLSPKVTEVVKAALAARENPSRPIPRVLFIGDSITGSYWEKVQSNLDGIAFVAKNPGNGEHSGTGARLVDQWIDLSQYRLSGQEYLELIDSVKTVFADFDRYAPDFAGRTPELAGFVWFQGIDDAGSSAFSTAYGDNLKAFIQDVRMEFNAPELPFVVAALGQHGDGMRAGQRAVHTAQMAIAGQLPKVASIDTIPFFFPKEQSPGGREWDFRHNAESFLLIGEAMGKAMVELQK